MKKNFKQKNFQKRSFNKPVKTSAPAQSMHVDQALKQRTGTKVILHGLVERIQQTAGPTVFFLFDGTGSLPLKGFAGAGARAFPEINEGDAIRAHITISEFRDAIEGEIDTLTKLAEGEKEKVQENIQHVERQRAQVEPPAFLIKDQILDKLQDRFVKAATEIRLAIVQNRPIIVRHHNDTDGYSAGFTLERAILPLIEKQHGGGKSEWEFYTRAPCSAPFYEIDDSIRDTATSLRNAAKFSNKMPLIIIVDNGSGPEDLLAIQQAKVHGINSIVVDHHFFDEDVISSEVLVHINPFLVGEDGARFSAGMLCTELARFINPDVKNIEQVAAMAGLADRTDNPDAIKQYLTIAEKEGYTKELLADISTVIDFVAAKLRFMEAREYIEVLFGEPRPQQKALVSLMAPYIRHLEQKGSAIAQSTVHVEKIHDVVFQILPIEETFARGFYPKPGKVTGLIHDAAVQKGNNKVVTAGVMLDAITMRATDAANFSVHKLIEHLNTHIPDAFVQGGGHKNAGAISFVPQKHSEVIKQLKEFIKKCN